MIPEINTTYNCFDDGKIRESRKYEVIVKEIVSFSDIDGDTLSKWKEQVTSCYWLYSEETDFFIKTIDEDGSEDIFVRTKNNGWFSISGLLNCGILDIDGSLTATLDSD